MKKMQNYKAKGKQVYVGIDVSKRKYSLSVRSEGMMVAQLTIQADYEMLGNYFRHNYPDCTIIAIYERVSADSDSMIILREKE